MGALGGWVGKRGPIISPIEGRDRCVLTRLLVKVGVVVMMVVVAMVYDHHNLRLRRIGCREAEDESQCEENLFHALV